MKGFAENFYALSYFYVISSVVERSTFGRLASPRNLMRPLDFARGDINYNTQRWCRPSAGGAS